jgi:hypothetical protein
MLSSTLASCEVLVENAGVTAKVNFVIHWIDGGIC